MSSSILAIRRGTQELIVIMVIRRLLSGSLLPVFLLAAPLGCDEDWTDGQAVALRPGWCTQCGIVYSNAATINGSDLSDIHLDDASTAGVKVRVGSSNTGQTFRLDVEPGTDRFIGYVIGNDDEAPITGAAFIGAKVAFEMPGGTFIDLEFTDYQEGIPSWADRGAPITAYRARYLGPSQAFETLCPATDPENQWFTLIPDEIYAPEVTASPRSVTIACVGEAAAKMKLLDFHPQGERAASTGERQTTLRMITADYCGTGESFTVTGTPVAWRDAENRVKPPTGEDVMEALWGANGAICLDTPRAVDRALVAAQCTIPLCEGDEEFRDGAVWRTMLPNQDG